MRRLTLRVRSAIFLAAALLAQLAYADQPVILSVYGGGGARTLCLKGFGAAGNTPDDICTPIGVFDPVAHSASLSASVANLGFGYAFAVPNLGNGATDFMGPDGSRQFEIYPFPGAVNYFSVEGNIAGGAPTLFAQGSDANIDADIAAKGTGNVVLGNGLGLLAQFQALNGLSPSVWPVFQSVQGDTVIYTASGDNTSINVLPTGTGGFSAGPSEVVTGGNSVALGRFNQSLGFASTALGNNNYALGNYSVSSGNTASDHYVVGKRSHMSALLGSAHGTTQISEQAFAIQSTSATPVTATSDAGAATYVNTIQVQANQTVASRILVVARNTTTGASAMWNILAYWNEGATASTLALVYSTGTGAPVASTGAGSTWTATLGTNTTTGYGYVICTGAAGETIRWTVRVDNVEDMNG
jgi:hypothetical protein